MRHPSKRSARRTSKRLKRLRAVLLALLALGGAALAWPRPAPAELALGNGRALHRLLARYMAAHPGEPCQDLGALVVAAEQGGYDVAVRNPFSGVRARFDDPAIARPLGLYRGEAAEAGVVYYQAIPDALGRVAWVVKVAGADGALQAVPAESDRR